MAADGAGFAVGERVFVHGLTSRRGATFNLRPARVVVSLCEDGLRVGVELLRGPSSTAITKGQLKRVQLSLKPCNLLRAGRPSDRKRILLAQVVATRPELRAVCRFLDERLPSGTGGLADGDDAVAAYTDNTSPLLFRVASFVAAPQALPHQFSGYMGRLWFEHWRYDARARPVAIGMEVHKPGGEGQGRPLTPRMDCAAASLEPECPGLALFAGGCSDHPQRCPRPFGFHKSAVLYDSLLQEWQPLPNMTTRRHGPGAACVGRKVYVVGGQYAHDSDDEDSDEMEGAAPKPGKRAYPRFCDVFDLDSRSWSLQPDSALEAVLRQDPHMQNALQRAAFFSVGSAAGRVLACLHYRAPGASGNVALAFNPAREDDGWRKVSLSEVEMAHPVLVGTSSCAATYRDELVVVSGRPSRFARCCAAFSFAQPSSHEDWHCGRWRQLPELNSARVGGALVVVEGKLYALGGVDEETGEFRADAERLDEAAELPCWTPCPWFAMPRALHAHDCLAMPTLARLPAEAE